MNFSALHEKLNQYINKGRLKSPWVVHYDCGSCNGCDIEVLACLTPVFDVERFGIVDCYNVVGGVDHVIPVDVYVPGCAAKPEAIIDGVVLALEVVKGKLGLRDMPQTTIFE